MGNTYKRLDDKTIEINGVIYTDGGSAPSAGSASVYPSEYIGGAGASNPTPSPTAPPATNPTNAANPSGYMYTPGSTAPVGGSAMDYATWLQGHTKYQAGVTREKAVKAAEADRQRAIVDAASAFDKSKVTYGANAERAASMGLQNSGYGEYLTGKAYATQRGEVQNANKVAGARKDEALYTEGQMNIQADQKYAADLLGIKEEQNDSYNSLYNSASSGASIESIMQDSRWGTLTKEQQTAIQQATTANSLMGRLEAGESIDAIKSTPEWGGLTIDQQTKLQTYYEGKVKTETEERNSANATNFSNWLGAINRGEATLDQIKTIPGYAELPEDMKTQLQAAQGKIESGKNDTIAYNSIATDIKNGNLTSEALEADERFKAITDEALKSQLRSEARTKDKARADEAHAKIFSEAIRNSENGDYTEENIESIPGWSGFSEIEKDRIRDTIEATDEKNYAALLADVLKGMKISDIENLSIYKNLSVESKKKLMSNAYKVELTNEINGGLHDVKSLEADERYKELMNTNPKEADLLKVALENKITAEKDANFKAVYNKFVDDVSYTALTNMEEWKKLSDEEQKLLLDEYVGKAVSSSGLDFEEVLSSGYNVKDEFSKTLSELGYSKQDIDTVIKRWEEQNLEELRKDGASVGDIKNAIDAGIVADDTWVPDVPDSFAPQEVNNLSEYEKRVIDGFKNLTIDEKRQKLTDFYREMPAQNKMLMLQEVKNADEDTLNYLFAQIVTNGRFTGIAQGSQIKQR
jgi:hypothetical protein